MYEPILRYYELRIFWVNIFAMGVQYVTEHHVAKITSITNGQEMSM
jgi:hypothetical protein